VGPFGWRSHGGEYWKRIATGKYSCLKCLLAEEKNDSIAEYRVGDSVYCTVCEKPEYHDCFLGKL